MSHLDVGLQSQHHNLHSLCCISIYRSRIKIAYIAVFFFALCRLQQVEIFIKRNVSITKNIKYKTGLWIPRNQKDKMKPEIHKSSFVAKTAVIIGNVKIGKNCGVFPNAVIRGDQNSICIGDGSNVQDCCVIHTNEKHSVKIGKNVSIGHGAIVHGATLEDECLLGMNATILNGAKIGRGSIIGANALVKTDMDIPENSLVLGLPGKVVKQDKKFRDMARHNAETYIELSKRYLAGKYTTYNKDQL